MPFPTALDNAAVLRDLRRAAALFQQRAIITHLGGEPPDPRGDRFAPDPAVALAAGLTAAEPSPDASA